MYLIKPLKQEDNELICFNIMPFKYWLQIDNANKNFSIYLKKYLKCDSVLVYKLDYVFNIGGDVQVLINQILDIIKKISCHRFNRKYLLDKPQGVRSRSSDNSFIQKKVSCPTFIKLKDGLLKTYKCVEKQILLKDNIKKFSRF